MEHLVDTFVNGTKNITKNPVLFVPYIIFFAITIVLAFILGIVIAMPIIAAIEGSEINWTFLGIGTLLFVVIILILSSHLSAGMIGMTKEAVSTGSTKLKDWMTYGNKYLGRVLFATILISIIELFMVVFWLPLIYVIMNSGYTIESFIELLNTNPDALLPFFMSLIIPGLIGCLLTIVYSIIVYVLLYFVTYAIVVDDMAVFASFKQSYAVLRQHFWKVLAFIIAIYIISAGVSSILSISSYFIMPLMSIDATLYSIASLILAVIQLIVSLILAVATIVWSTRFYMVITEKKLHAEEDLTRY